MALPDLSSVAVPALSSAVDSHPSIPVAAIVISDVPLPVSVVVSPGLFSGFRLTYQLLLLSFRLLSLLLGRLFSLPFHYLFRFGLGTVEQKFVDVSEEFSPENVRTQEQIDTKNQFFQSIDGGWNNGGREAFFELMIRRDVDNFDFTQGTGDNPDFLWTVTGE